MDFMKRVKVFKDITALHSKSKAIMKLQQFKSKEEDSSLLKQAMKRWLAPVDHIRSYYGEEVAIYYEWMNFFLRWMMVPAVLGLTTRVFNTFYFGDTGHSPLNALFSIFISIWAALFAIKWKQHQRSLKILWDNLNRSERNFKQIREAFVGVPKINPVTEQVEPYYPSKERYMRYLESLVVCFVLLMVIFVYLVAMYNITGVITEEGKFHSLFYIEWLADFAKEGAIFDAQTNWVLIPTIA